MFKSIKEFHNSQGLKIPFYRLWIGIFTKKNGPAHAIFLTYKNDKGNPILFKYLIDPHRINLNIGMTITNRPVIKKDWKINFNIKDIPQKKTEINAWAFDAILGKAYLLEHDLTMDVKG